MDLNLYLYLIHNIHGIPFFLYRTKKEFNIYYDHKNID